jgi:hypothetical protein
MLTAIEQLINREIPEFKIDGYEAKAPPPEVKPPPAQPLVNRHEASLFGGAAPVRKTLGGKFRSTRRRRL